MMKLPLRLFVSTSFALLVCLLLPAVLRAESLLNDPTTGTAVNKLVKLTPTNAAIITSAGDRSGSIGLCIFNCGIAGNPIVQASGYGNCVFDGPTTANDIVQQSATVAGDCTDAGPGPSSGQLIGRVLFTHAAAGIYTISFQANGPRSVACWFLPGALTSTTTFGQYAPTVGSHVRAVDTWVHVAGSGCSTPAVVSILINVSDQTAAHTTMGNGANGPITSGLNLPVVAGSSIQGSIQTAAAGCGTNPTDLNLCVELTTD